MDIVYGIGFGLMCVAAAGLVIYKQWRRRHPPTKWTHSGLIPPPGTENALQILAERTGVKGGKIQWVEGPWLVGYPLGQFQAAGEVIDFQGHKIKLMWFERIEISALAHEVRHLKNGDGHEDAAFYAEVAADNKVIREALGR